MNDKALNIKIPSELYDKLKNEAEKKEYFFSSVSQIDLLRVF